MRKSTRRAAESKPLVVTSKDVVFIGLDVHKKNVHAAVRLNGRELTTFVMPADASVMADPESRRVFETYWATPGHAAIDRMKLFKLAWDLLGSEFGGRQLQYEKFYAGPSFVVRNHSFRECPWEGLGRSLDQRP